MLDHARFERTPSWRGVKRSMLAATAALGIMPATAVADEPVVPPPSVPVIGAALAAPAGPLPAVACTAAAASGASAPRSAAW